MDILLITVACFVNVALGLMVLQQGIHRPFVKWFCLLCFSITIWIIFNFLTSHYFGSVALVQFANACAYPAAFVVMITGLMFTYTFPRIRSVSTQEKVALIVGILGVFTLSCTPLVAGTTSVSSDSISYGVGEFIPLYGASFLIILVLILRNLTILPKDVGALVRSQAKQVLAAFFLSAGAGLVVNVVLPSLGFGWEWAKLSPLISLILVGVIAYSIVRHGLFDIRTTAVRSVAYILTFSCIAATYYLGGYFLSSFMTTSGVTQSQTSIINMLLALLMALLFQPIKDYFDKVTNKIFYRGSYDSSELIRLIGKKISSTIDLHTLLQGISTEIGKQMNLETVQLVAEMEGELIFSNYGKVPAVDSETFNRIKKTKAHDMVVVHRSEGSPLSSALERLGVVVFIPFVYNHTFIGFLGLGKRKAGTYTQRDFRVLATIGPELAVAVQNALSVQKIRNFNNSLKQEVEHATADLRATNKKLKAMDQTKDDFISLTSHQLRTPLTTIKGYLSMLLDGDAGVLTPQQKKLLQEAFNSSQRMVHLISDFLNISRIQTGKFVLELNEIDLADILDEEIDQLRLSAQSRGITLAYDKPAHFPTMLVDEGKIRQVMMNYIDNAIYYSPAATTIHIVLSFTAEVVEFKVIDQGIGVPKAEQHKLFTKFSRASNARKQRPDGTGIGLFMAKKVIVALGGAVIFKSEEGKGSAFGFRLNRP